MSGQEPTVDRAASAGHVGPVGSAPDGLFVAGLSTLLGSYVVLILAILVALGAFTSPSHLLAATQTEEIRYAMRLSLLSCTLSTLLSLWVAIPSGYVLSRFRFPLRNLVDAVLDIPIVLPPLVMGLGLLVLFQTPLGRAIERIVPVTVRRAEHCAGAVYRGLRVRRANDASDVRPDQSARGTGGP